MPIYEYQCPDCGQVFEEWAHITDTPEWRPCPQCGARAPHILSNTAFVLKGGGWYVTDYGYRKNVSENSEDASTPAPVSTENGAAPAATTTGTTGTADAAKPAGTAPESKAAAPAAPAAPAAGQSAGKSAPPASPAASASPAA